MQPPATLKDCVRVLGCYVCQHQYPAINSEGYVQTSDDRLSITTVFLNVLM